MPFFPFKSGRREQARPLGIVTSQLVSEKINGLINRQMDGLMGEQMN